MRIGPQRPIDPEAIVAPQGYRVEALITGLSFPSSISFGTGGELYLSESGGVAGSVVGMPRVLRIDPDRSVTEIGRLDNPIVGLVYRHGELLIAEDAPAPRILRVTAEGDVQMLVENLPGGGDYGLSGLSLDASGALLFGLGTRTNSGVVGLDNAARGWVARHPEWADIPGQDVQLAGVNYVTAQPGFGGTSRLTTGGFKAFGHRAEQGETVRGAARCGGAVYRMAPDATEAERLAWGFRNPVGLRAAPDGRLFVAEGGMEERGSRPIAGAPDNLWEVQPGGFYGWPDYASGIPVTDPRFRLPGQPQPRRLLSDTPRVAGTPTATFAPRAGVGRFDFSTSEVFGFVGEALVALSGEWSSAAYPASDGAPAGYRVVRVDPRTGQVTDFLVNRQPGPASAGGALGTLGGLERPVEVRFDPSGEILYVVDMGEARLTREYGLEPFGGTGVVWRITRVRPMLLVPPKEEAAPMEDEPETDEGGQDEPESADETGAPEAEGTAADTAENADEASGADVTPDASADAGSTDADEAPRGVDTTDETPASEAADDTGAATTDEGTLPSEEELQAHVPPDNAAVLPGPAGVDVDEGEHPPVEHAEIDPEEEDPAATHDLIASIVHEIPHGEVPALADDEKGGEPDIDPAALSGAAAGPEAPAGEGAAPAEDPAEAPAEAPATGEEQAASSDQPAAETPGPEAAPAEDSVTADSAPMGSETPAADEGAPSGGESASEGQEQAE